LVAGTYNLITNTTPGNVGAVLGTAPATVTVGGYGLAAGTVHRSRSAAAT